MCAKPFRPETCWACLYTDKHKGGSNSPSLRRGWSGVAAGRFFEGSASELLGQGVEERSGGGIVPVLAASSRLAGGQAQGPAQPLHHPLSLRFRGLFPKKST